MKSNIRVTENVAEGTKKMNAKKIQKGKQNEIV